MDNYKRAEKRLRNFNVDKTYLESLEKKLQLMEEEYSITGVSYDNIGGSTGVSDVVGNVVARVVDDKTELEMRIKRISLKLEHLANVLNSLTEKEKTVIVMFYIEHKQMWKIRQAICYEKTQTNAIKNDAMAKVVRGLYGE